MAFDNPASNVCFDIKPLPEYFNIAVQEAIEHNVTGDGLIWRLRVKNLAPKENYIISIKTQMNESSQILSEINIFGASRKENHEFLSTTTFHLGPIGEELLIEVGNVNSSNYTTNTHLTKNYNLSIVLDNPFPTNGNIPSKLTSRSTSGAHPPQ